MSCREVGGQRPLQSGNGKRGNSNCGNVVQLQPVAAGGGLPAGAPATRKAPALAPDAVTRDGLDLLKAFFAIGDAPARAALLLMAQRLARQPKR
jgi:hypothetical protein